MRFDGILHNFHVIGEAVKALPEAVRSQYPDIPWRDIAGTRDFIAHAYFLLDLDILGRESRRTYRSCGHECGRFSRTAMSTRVGRTCREDRSPGGF